jgi:hypothetical protein
MLLEQSVFSNLEMVRLKVSLPPQLPFLRRSWRLGHRPRMIFLEAAGTLSLRAGARESSHPGKCTCPLYFFFFLYLSRNLAATQTLKIRCLAYQKYSSKAEAEAAYARAVRWGEVETL